MLKITDYIRSFKGGVFSYGFNIMDYVRMFPVSLLHREYNGFLIKHNYMSKCMYSMHIPITYFNEATH